MRVTRLVSLVSGSLATVLNSLLIPIILTRSSPRVGRYKYFLLAYTLNACYFTVSQISILPVGLATKYRNLRSDVVRTLQWVFLLIHDRFPPPVVPTNPDDLLRFQL